MQWHVRRAGSLAPILLLLALAAPLLAVGQLATQAVATASGHPGAARAGDLSASGAVAPFAAVSEACGGDNPYFAVSRLTTRAGADPSPCLLAFHDTPGDDLSEQLALATWSQLGAVYGLAYDWRRDQLYVAAYHRRMAPFGPGGPGQVYRVDLYTGEVTPFARLDAGPDRHVTGDPADSAAAAWVGLTGIGDLEVDSSGNQLLVLDLADRKVHRLRLPDGAPLGSFDTGGMGEPWSERARPFGLGTFGPYLYHGVIELDPGAGPPLAHLYRSLPDGGAMTEVARLDLGYRTDPAWGTWTTSGDGDAAEPMMADIDFRPDGTPIVGLRDRRGDAGLRSSAGDVLPLEGTDGAWGLAADPERYQDRFVADESLLGGLASFPGVDLLVAAAASPLVAGTAGAVYFDNATGRAIGRETVAVGASGGADAIAALGDVESLCGPPGMPTLAPTPRPSATPSPAYLPLALAEQCSERHVDVALVLDLSTSMLEATPDGVPKHAAAAAAARQFLDLCHLSGAEDQGTAGDRAALVGFNSTAWTEVPLAGDRARLDAGLARLPAKIAAGTRLDLALRQGDAVLATAAEPGRVGALVLLTDGVPSGVPAAEDGSTTTTVLRAAEAARARGTWIFTVAFGGAADVDQDLLQAIAGDPARHFATGRAEELAAVYAQLAQLLRCLPGRHAWSQP